jgi:RHS repeat-associated protein
VCRRSCQRKASIPARFSAGQSTYTYYADGTLQSATTDGPAVISTASTGINIATSASSNRTTSITGDLTRSYTYDAAGHVLSDGTNTFSYNNAGRLISATNSRATTTYSYNALGQRVRKITPSGTTLFVCDEVGHLLGEYDASGDLIEEIVWLDDIPVASIRPGQGGGVGILYIHTDALNSPTRMTRSDDNVVVWRWDHDPYGNGVAMQDPDGKGANVVFNMRFPGQYFDAETGLYYNYFRDYDPTIGRYVESDPIGLLGGISTYSYAAESPPNVGDPLGLRPLTDAETQFIEKFFGSCLDPKTLNLHVRKFGDTQRALSLWPGFTSLPSSTFVGGSGANSINLGDPYAASVFGHEALHQAQRASGINVTGDALGLQAQYSLHISDPYQYNASTDPVQMLNTFLNGNVEQQGQIFQDYLYAFLNGQDVSAFSLIASYVKGNCMCAK